MQILTVILTLAALAMAVPTPSDNGHIIARDPEPAPEPICKMMGAVYACH